MRFFDGEVFRILYRSKRNTTGLTDVKVDIWDGTPTKLVSAGVLTELSAGLYYYDYTIPTTGNYTFNITCATQAHDVEGSFIAVGRQTPYWNKRGGGSMIVREKFPKEKFEQLDDRIEKITKLVNKLIKETNFTSEAVLKITPVEVIEERLKAYGN